MTTESSYLRPLDFDGLSLTGTDYEGNFLVDFDIAAQFPLEVVQSEAPGEFPQFIRGDPSDRVLPLHIIIQDSSQAKIDTLKRYFSPSASPAFLRVEDDDGNVRRVRVKSLGLTPWEGHDDQSYVASLHASEPVWEMDAYEQEDGLASGTSNPIDLQNSGNERAYPAFVMTPAASKGNANGPTDHWPVVIAWRSPLEGVDSLGGPYPIDIMDRGWDTAALIAAGDLLANGDDIRVFVDGEEVNRYLDGIDTTGTAVWCSIAFQPERTSTLATGISDSSPGYGEDLPVEGIEGTTAFPDSGALLVGDECITYRGKTLTSFLDIRRARRGTSAAPHDAGDVIRWVEHDIRVVSNYSGAGPPMDEADRKPIIDLAASTNTHHLYGTTDGMIEPDSLRAGQWIRERRSEGASAPFVRLSQDGGVILVEDALPEAGAPNFDTISLYAPCLIESLATGVALTATVDHLMLAQVSGADLDGFESVIHKRDVLGWLDGIAFASRPDYLVGAATPANLTLLPAADLSRLTLSGLVGSITGLSLKAGASEAVGATFDEAIGQTFSLDGAQEIRAGFFYLVKASLGFTGDARVKLTIPDTSTPDIDGVLIIDRVDIDNADIPSGGSDFFEPATVNFRNPSFTPLGSIIRYSGPVAMVVELAISPTGNLLISHSRVPSYPGGQQWKRASGTWTARSNEDAVMMLVGLNGDPQTDAELGSGRSVQWSDVLVNFNPDYTPQIVRGARQDGYLVDATLENQTTGQIFDILAPLLVDSGFLKIDVNPHVVAIAYEDDDHEVDALWAVEPAGQLLTGERVRDLFEWMRLDPGVNDLLYVEEVTAGSNVRIISRWRSRWT